MTKPVDAEILVLGVRPPIETFLGQLFRGLAVGGTRITIQLGKKVPVEPGWPNLRFRITSPWRHSAVLWVPILAFRFLCALLRDPRQTIRVTRRWRLHARRRDGCRSLYRVLPLVGTRFTALYFPWVSAAAGYDPLLACRKPSIVSARGSQVLVAPLNPLHDDSRVAMLRALHEATLVHCVSNQMASVVEKYGVNRRKIRIIQPAVDTQFFSPPQNRCEPCPKVRLVMVGALSWVKGYEYAFLAFRELSQAGIDFAVEIIGEGQDRQRLNFTAHDLAISDRVHLVGRKNQAEVLRSLRECHIFTHSSLSEGISNAVLEAMACACPVVVTDVGGMREVIRDGVEGYLVPPRDPGRLAQSIAELIADPQKREDLGSAARQRVTSKHGIERHMAQWEALLQDVGAYRDEAWEPSAS